MILVAFALLTLPTPAAEPVVQKQVDAIAARLGVPAEDIYLLLGEEPEADNAANVADAPQAHPSLIATGSLLGREFDSIRSPSEVGKALRAEASLDVGVEDGLARDPASPQSFFGWLGWAVALWLVFLLVRAARTKFLSN